MKNLTHNEPLTEAELDRLGVFLDCCKGGKAMNVEQLDGFFVALIAGPEIVMPSEYNREVFGGACDFGSLEEAKDILGLMTRHWNTNAGTLLEGEGYMPLLLKNENGVAHGNDWARGFMRGMNMRHGAWGELVNDEEHGRCLVPMFMLSTTNTTKTPRCAPRRSAQNRLEKAILHMAAGLVGAYRYFREQRQADAGADFPEQVSSASKVGRNELRPCGSGKKYKRSCGSATINCPRVNRRGKQILKESVALESRRRAARGLIFRVRSSPHPAAICQSADISEAVWTGSLHPWQSGHGSGFSLTRDVCVSSATRDV